MDKQEKKLSWNREYFMDDCWRVVGTDQEVDWLPGTHCNRCAYAGEDENGGDGIECIYRETDPECAELYAEIYACNKCDQLHVDFQKPNGTGWWDILDGSNIGIFLNIELKEKEL